MSFWRELFGNEKEYSYIFPYSDDPQERRRQIWENLQHGILFEDKKLFIPWETPYRKIGSVSERIDKRGDRTYWYLGKREILHGLDCHVEVLKWVTQPDVSSVDQISDNLGHDLEGNQRFLSRIDHLTALLGEPTQKELTEAGSLHLGIVMWEMGKARISLTGVEVWNCRYNLNVGLIDNSHDRDQKKAMDELRAQGFTEEDFGK
jgi:hypothetical protein